MAKPFVAVVTGASSGIGQAVAIEFAKRHAHVILHCRSNLQGLNSTIQQIHSLKASSLPTAHPTSLRAIVSDIQDSHSNRLFVHAAFEQFGYVDAWINTAGADVLTGDARKLSFSQKLASLWTTDVHGTFVLSRLVASKMMEQTSDLERLPSIVHIGWDQAEHGMEGDSGQYFSAIKSAVAAFSKSLAKSVSPRVRVNCIAPGWVQTQWGNSSSSAWQQRAIGESSLQRWGQAVDVARVIASISFQDGAFINGQTIAVNGGWQSMSLTAKCESNLNE